MKKKLYMGTNLKMYKNRKETSQYLRILSDDTQDISKDNLELFVIPSYTSLPPLSNSKNSLSVTLGAQNMSWEEEGQFTGEISVQMLEEVGLRLVMIGHSERRHVFGETDIEENKKVLTALRHGFTVLLCIGETKEQKNYGISDEVLRTQIKIGLHNISPENTSKIWVAYEPVWSIGVNGTPATEDYAEKMHQLIKNTLRDLFGSSADCIPVLYGGSVNPQNAPLLISQPSIDGLFIGRSAWNAEQFSLLIHDIYKLYQNI